MTVRHPRYGLGTVVNLGGFAKRRTVTVEFRDDGHSETFIAAKCPLQPVGMR
jgi:DNA helicase-2/ATP-dependent DNA helicase PcrA